MLAEAVPTLTKLWRWIWSSFTAAISTPCLKPKTHRAASVLVTCRRQYLASYLASRSFLAEVEQQARCHRNSAFQHAHNA